VKNSLPTSLLKIKSAKGTILLILLILIPVILIACAPVLNKLLAKMDLIAPAHPDTESTQTLTVFAAASLTDAFQEIGREFEKINPGVKVIFSFSGSQVLRTQIEQGAVADVYASADHKNMDTIAAENLIDMNSYQDFATNRMVVILPPGNPAALESLHDLTRPHLKLVMADPSVPAGNYARQILSRMSEDPVFGEDFTSAVLVNVVSNETDVRQVVTKVELGEADAGIVYTSDAVAAHDLNTIAIPDNFNVSARYPIAILNNSSNPDLAAKFIAYVNSPAGQAIMEKWGFKTGN
jgi:molybdate transport system substrate-binding protein